MFIVYLSYIYPIFIVYLSYIVSCCWYGLSKPDSPDSLERFAFPDYFRLWMIEDSESRKARCCAFLDFRSYILYYRCKHKKKRRCAHRLYLLSVNNLYSIIKLPMKRVLHRLWLLLLPRSEHSRHEIPFCHVLRYRT